MGPIFDTISRTRSTRAVFNASYVFSWLVKNIILEYLHRISNGNPGSQHFESILIPYVVNEGDMFGNDTHAGLFHDRVIVLSNDPSTDWEHFLGAIEATLYKLSGSIAEDLNLSRINDRKDPLTVNEINQLNDFVLNYFKTYAVCVDVESTNNHIDTVDNLLNAMELRPNLLGNQETDLFFQWLELRFVSSFRHFTLKDSFAQTANKRFESILEVSLSEHVKRIKSLGEDFYWSVFSDKVTSVNQEIDDPLSVITTRIPDLELFKYHRYFAVVRADADFLGRAIASLFKEKGSLGENPFGGLSNSLFAFSLKATKEIEDWGAMPIFLGGDDVLCFCPVMCNGKSVIDLCLVLDKLFTDTLRENATLWKVISTGGYNVRLSFGVSIGYYKHPMSELISDSYHLLTDAKKMRHAIGISVLKHSGTRFQTVIKCLDAENAVTSAPEARGFEDNQLAKWIAQSDIARVANALRIRLIADVEKDKRGTFISSIQYKIKEIEPLLDKTLLSNEARLKATFDNFFNEDIHKKNNTFLEIVRSLLFHLYALQVRTPLSDSDDAPSAELRTINTLYFVLRFIQFTLQKHDSTDDK